MNVTDGYSVAIPAYGRPIEFEELLTSINVLDKVPDEVIICEDFSKERAILKEIAKKWEPTFVQKGCKFRFIENEKNLGYDGNIRKLIQESSYKWVILIGNDDLFLKDGLDIIDKFCKKNPMVGMISRPYIRFNTDINRPLGYSKLFPSEKIVIHDQDSSKYVFRICGFVGGLIVNKDWAEKFHTNKYDGSLFYQIYLASHAFCTNGIGYLGENTVGARADNPPLFGESGAENHIPGSYSAKGRASMWNGVLTIAKQVGDIYKIDLLSDLKQELTVRQSFHVFEMNAGAKKNELRELKTELTKIGLFDHWFPRVQYALNYTLGRYSKFFYKVARKIIQ